MTWHIVATEDIPKAVYVYPGEMEQVGPEELEGKLRAVASHHGDRVELSAHTGEPHESLLPLVVNS